MQPHPHAAQDDEKKQQKHRVAADHAQFLADHGEDKVRLLGRDGAALGLRPLVQPRPFQAAGGQGQLALGGLEQHTVAPGVDLRGIGRDDAVLLVVRQKVVPGVGDHRRHGRGPDDEPVKFQPAGKEQHQKDGKENQRAAQVARNHHDHAEGDCEMHRQLGHGEDIVETAVLLQVADVLCQYHDKGDLDHLAWLDADA